jgi:mono/diheme cytochrome c family protein
MKNIFCATLAAVTLIAGGAIAVAQDQAQIEAGAQLYDENCSPCHGEQLRTTGSAADLRDLGANDRPRFDKALAEGRGQMPSWEGVLSAAEKDQLWAYIRAHAR